MKKLLVMLVVCMFGLIGCGQATPEEEVAPATTPIIEEMEEVIATPTMTPVINEDEVEVTPTATPFPSPTPVIGESSGPNYDPNVIAPKTEEEEETTSVPTGAPTESEDEMKDYYVDPNTGEKVEIVPTTTPEPTPEVSEEITLYGEIVGVRIDKDILTFDIHVACPHGDNGMCYAGNYLAYKANVEVNAENEKLYSKGSIVQVSLDKIPGKCSAVTHFLTLDKVKVVK